MTSATGIATKRLADLVDAANKKANGSMQIQRRLQNLKEARKIISQRRGQTVLEKALELSHQEVEFGNSDLAEQAISHIGWLSRSIQQVCNKS